MLSLGGCLRAGFSDVDRDAASVSSSASITCEEGKTSHSGETGDDPTTVQSVTGTNGSFSDACDGSGNLTEYLCETKMECGPGPNPACYDKQTGKVIPKTYDCNGKCNAGTCDARCPASGQQLTYESVDQEGNPVLKNSADGRRYACQLTWDNPKDAYDCVKAPFVGEKGRVASLGLSTHQCTGGEIGNIGVAIEGVQPPTGGGQHCTYTCSITD